MLAAWVCASVLAGVVSSSRHLRLEPASEFHAFFTGERFFLTCLPDPRSGATRLTWQTPNGRDITHTRGRVHVEPSAHNLLGLELVVEEVKHKDQGTWTCSAVVDGRDTRVSFELKVYQSLSFWDTPDTQVGEEGSTFLVKCTVRADPSPVVSWYLNGSLILDDERRSALEDGLLIRGLKMDDAGRYTCRAFVVTPHKSQIQERNINLQVHYMPSWREGTGNTFYAAVGGVGNLSCEAHGEPPPTFEWFRGRALLGNSQIYRIHNGRYASILQVKIKSNSNLGSYLCLVSNPVGEIQKELFLIEGAEPLAPNVSATSDEPGALTLRVQPPAPGAPPVRGYRIQWRQAQNTWASAREYLTGAGTDFLLQDLHLDTEYAVRVSAVNDLGSSDFGETLLARTKGPLVETVLDGGALLSPTQNNAPPSSTPFFAALLLVVIALFFQQPSLS